ncbi:MAG TPA: hypothetical protein PLN85_00915 [archaeon]|mgnify:CR=1 FL=1|nr:hypothetical protein [archaeon]
MDGIINKKFEKIYELLIDMENNFVENIEAEFNKTIKIYTNIKL